MPRRGHELRDDSAGAVAGPAGVRRQRDRQEGQEAQEAQAPPAAQAQEAEGRTMSTANHRSTAALVAFLAAILCLAVIGSGKAEAAVGINGFFIKPSTTQAGGHPDVE